MRRRIAGKGTGRFAASGEEQVGLDNRPLCLVAARDGKRVIVVQPYEIWVVHAITLEVEKTIELPTATPTAFEAPDDGVLWLGGQHLWQGSLWSAKASKTGSKLGGFVDHVCQVRPRLLCGVGAHGEVLWDLEQEDAVHRRKTADHHVYGLTASADGRAVFIDGTSQAWVIDPDHPSGYMQIKFKTTSEAEVADEGVAALASMPDGRVILGARDGGIAWTNRTLRLIEERFPSVEARNATPLALASDGQYIYALRGGGVLHRFLIAQPEADPEAEEEPEPLPEAQMVRLQRKATCLACGPDGTLLLAGPQADDQLGRLWKAPASALKWEDLRLRERKLVEAPPPRDSGPATKKPDFTPTKTKISGPPISSIKVDEVLAGRAQGWMTKAAGVITERPTRPADPAAVLPADALLLPAMFRFHEGTARPGLVLWRGVPDHRPVPSIALLTWGDQPRGWVQLDTPSIRAQGWSRREVFPLQVALAHAPPDVAGNRPALPKSWTDRELFAALGKECKKLLKVLW